MTAGDPQRPTTARDAMLQALGPAAVAMQMAPSPEQVLAALAAAGWVVVPADRVRPVVDIEQVTTNAPSRTF